MGQERRLPPALLPLLRLVGQLSAAATICLPLSAVYVQASTCDGTVINSGPVFTTSYSARTYCRGSRSWRLLSTINDTNISLQLYDIDIGYFADQVTITDERNISTSYRGYESYLFYDRKIFLGKSGSITFFAYGSSNYSSFSAYIDSVDMGSYWQCYTNSHYWCTGRCISRAWLCDKHRDCYFGEDEADCFSTTTSSFTTNSATTGSSTASGLTTSMQATTYSCGGLLDDSRYIQSPNYPEKYPNGVTCTWQFFSKSSGSNLTLQFKTFYIEKDFDYLIIYDERNLSRKYTGSSVPLTVTLGASGWMTFYSDSSVGFSGFKAYFESAGVKNLSQCRTSDVYWCASSRRCISVNWYCDGRPDCAIKEDESQCSNSSSNSSTILAISLPISIVIVVIIVSIVLVILKRRRDKLNHLTDNQRCRQDSSTPAHNPAYSISSDPSAPPPSPPLRLSSSDPPLYSDVVNSHQPAGPEAEEPPAYYTVCGHGLAI